jgi:hypothetical protein
MSLSLAERMAAITKLENAAPFTLSHYLYIYTSSNHQCYIDYMQGAESLYRYLTQTAPLNWEVEKYPNIDNPSFKVPRLLAGGYEGQELIKILTVGGLQGDWKRTQRAIFIITNNIRTIRETD